MDLRSIIAEVRRCRRSLPLPRLAPLRGSGSARLHPRRLTRIVRTYVLMKPATRSSLIICSLFLSGILIAFVLGVA